MGADLLEAEPELFDRYMAQAGEASGLPIRELCLEGPIENLTETHVAQPALFALSLAVAECARSIGLRPDFVAGHSLGEYTAAVSSGALAPEDGMALVSRRGGLMGQIQSERPGAMGAVIGLSAQGVEEICERAASEGLVTVANLNAPTQTVISGESGAVDKALELAEEAGARRALRLQVGAAFHSALMEPVQAELDEAMQALTWNDAGVPLAANHSGELVSGGDEIRHALVTQIASPVRWVDCVETLIGAGCDTFLELGPGRVLGGLVRQIDPDVTVATADSPKQLEEFAEAHPDLAG
jgi:[acyl-carrier-protein] S-malonyltransferase